jgi:4'-phosphopantetheinyl transferase
MTTWSRPEEGQQLGEEEVHVWRVSLKGTAERIARMSALLNPDERQRAGRFHFEKDRVAFVLARGTLRSVLGRYLGQPPARLRFSYNEWGKPQLLVREAEPSVDFNLSHSGEFALIAVTRGREVGVDVEHIREDFATDDVARRFFSDREYRELSCVDAGRRPRAFFDCWTRKEAFIKAVGQGLSFPLAQFVVSLQPGEPAALLHIEGHPEELPQWTLRELSVHPDYAAAVAVKGRPWNLRCLDWQDAT